MADQFRCVAMDPPWNERGGGKIKRGADRHYPLMKLSDIYRTVISAEPWADVSPDAHCWMWVTDNFLRDGLALLDLLGFRYVRTLVWVKETKEGKLKVGLGQYLRGSHELCLFGVRGKAMIPGVKPLSVLKRDRGRHSEKPDDAYSFVFESVSRGPYLEMFARQPRDGWTVWGNEVETTP